MFNRFFSDLTGQGERKGVIGVSFRIIWHCMRLLAINRCGTQAAALSYHTMFGVVPLAIVILMVFQMFPASKDIGDKVRQMVYEQMNLTKITYPSDLPGGDPITLAQKINEITGQYLSNLSTGAITFIGGLLTILAAISLLTTIEKSFNTIWGVPKSRDILHRTINYWAILTLGPLLIGLGIYLSTLPLSQAFQESVFRFIRPVFSFGISVAMLFCLYMFLPNAKVKVEAAMAGAIVAAIFWMAAKFGFGIYVTKLIPYQEVYGIMGLIPLAVFWIYIVWLIVLVGLQLTYATQHVHSLEKAERLAKLRAKQTSFIATEQTTIQIMREVLVAFEDKNRKPVTPSEISTTMALAEDFVERILENLTHAGLLCKTTEPVVGYVPSTDGANITLAEVSLAMEKSSFQSQNPKLRQVMEQVRAELAKFNLKDIL
jgi:membrane protein